MFIVLTDVRDKEPLFISINKIVYFYPVDGRKLGREGANARILLAENELFYIKETPEIIMQKIKESQNDNHR